MSFSPAFCPNRLCVFNGSAQTGFASRHGFFPSRSAGHPIVRFRCKGCRRTFSYSTFRASYRQKKPHLDAQLFRMLTAGVSLRGAARLLQVNRKTVFAKLARLSEHSRRLHHQLLAAHPVSGHFQLDELETFESNRYQPVTVPVLIEKTSYFVVGTTTAPIRRKGRMTRRQKQLRKEHEATHGRRPTQSDAAVKRCLGYLARHAAGPVRLDSDRKPSYGRLGRNLLGTKFEHSTHDSRARRDRSNPLFPINHTNAMLRYCMARLRRRSWCVSRRRMWLQRHLWLYAGWFNYCRGITIKTDVSPAQQMGLARRQLTASEWLSWRQNWHNAGRILPTPLRPASACQ